jgi:hypothetical protein
LNEPKSQVNWRLTIRASLVMTAVGLILFGVLQADQLQCRVTWKEQVLYYFALFGFFAAFGYAIGWTLPPGSAETPEGKHIWSVRQGFWKGSLGLGSLMLCIFVAISLFR